MSIVTSKLWWFGGTARFLAPPPNKPSGRRIFCSIFPRASLNRPAGFRDLEEHFWTVACQVTVLTRACYNSWSRRGT